MFKLYPFQKELVDNVLNEHRRLPSENRILVCSPTGSGKTVMMSHIAQQLNVPTLVVVHRSEIVDQNHSSLEKTFSPLPVGKLQAGQPITDTQIHSCSIQTLSSWAKRGFNPGIPPVELLLVDEAHLNKAKQLSDILASGWLADNCRVIGFTATPSTLSGTPLGDVYDLLINGPTTAELQQLKRLPPFKVLTAPEYLDLNGVSKSQGDYNGAAVLRNNPATRQADIAYKAFTEAVTAGEISNTAPGIIFMGSVEASEETARRFEADGYSIRHIDGKTPADERKAAVEGLADGNVQIISNVAVFAEGFDCPRVSWVMLARPTASLALHLQQFGRGLRGTQPIVILDPAGNVLRHGLPTDIDEWQLDQEQEKRKYRNRDDGGIVSRITADNIDELMLTGFVEILESGERIRHEGVDPRKVRTKRDDLLDEFFQLLTHNKPNKPVSRLDVRALLYELKIDRHEKYFLFAAYVKARMDSLNAFKSAMTKTTANKSLEKIYAGCALTERGLIPIEEINLLLEAYGFKAGKLKFCEEHYKRSKRIKTPLAVNRFDLIEQIQADLLGEMTVDAVLYKYLNALRDHINYLAVCCKQQSLNAKRFAARYR